MIHKIEIENFKSAQNLSFELKRFNVLIGENGSGKSNILEAIAFASCALTGRLNPSNDRDGFEEDVKKSDLELKGVRINEPQYYRSGFDKKNLNEQMNINLFADDDYKVQFEINNTNKPFAKWESFIPIAVEGRTGFTVEEFASKETNLRKALNISRAKINSLNLKNYIIYSPENFFIRNYNLNESSYLEPIGFRGEGLLKLLKIIAVEKKEQFDKIVENLQLFDWFESIELSNNTLLNETEFFLKDRYLDEGLKSFSMSNSNEGFYFVLFYLTLFISDYTPKFFAIDNIDTSLNPKLCTKLISVLFELALKYDKQVIFTTHSPAILDGLDLNNSEQRLYAISRNKLGNTKATRIQKKQPLEGIESLRLSEQYLRGSIGALPKNF